MHPEDRKDWETVRETVERIRQYGADTLSGRADGPANKDWYREGVREMTQRAHKALAAIEERLLADEPKENPAPDWQAAERAIYAYAEDYAPAEPMDEEERLVDAMIGLLSDDAFRKALGVDGLPGRSQADEKEEPIAWVHGCHIQGNNVELWLPSCPSCGMPRSKAPALRSREEG